MQPGEAQQHALLLHISTTGHRQHARPLQWAERRTLVDHAFPLAEPRPTSGSDEGCCSDHGPKLGCSWAFIAVVQGLTCWLAGASRDPNGHHVGRVLHPV